MSGVFKSWTTQHLKIQKPLHTLQFTSAIAMGVLYDCSVGKWYNVMNWKRVLLYHTHIKIFISRGLLKKLLGRFDHYVFNISLIRISVQPSNEKQFIAKETIVYSHQFKRVAGRCRTILTRNFANYPFLLIVLGSRFSTTIYDGVFTQAHNFVYNWDCYIRTTIYDQVFIDLHKQLFAEATSLASINTARFLVRMRVWKFRF